MDLSSPWGPLELERRTSRYLGLGQAAAIIAVLVAFILKRLIPPWVPLAVSLLALAAILAWLAFLFLRYGKIPLVVEKRGLMREQARLAALVAEAEAALRRAARNRQAITIEGERSLADRQARHDALLASFARRRGEIEAARDRELNAALEALQRSFVYDGLRSQTLKGGKIPGVGPKLKERLAAAGVNAAVDVSEARLRGLPGFGEAKIASILVWRRQPSSGHRSGVALTR